MTYNKRALIALDSHFVSRLQLLEEFERAAIVRAAVVRAAVVRAAVVRSQIYFPTSQKLTLILKQLIKPNWVLKTRRQCS